MFPVNIVLINPSRETSLKPNPDLITLSKALDLKSFPNILCDLL